MPRQEPVDKAVFVKVNDETKGFSLAESIEENNAFDASSSDQPATGLEANKVVNDGDGEVKVLNWVQQAIDVESTSDNDTRDQVSELETKVLVDGKQDDAKVVVWPMSKTMTSQTKNLMFFYEKFHIPLEVHPVLPSRSGIMHERPAGKIGLYTRFFDFSNFRLPLSTFLVDILRHFRINISQLSVIGAAKVSHLEILCRVYGVTPTVGLFHCFYVNSKKNGWMSFIKHSDKSPVAADFNVQDYAPIAADFNVMGLRRPWMTLLALRVFCGILPRTRHYTLDEETYPLFLDKDGEDIDIFAFIHTSDPTKEQGDSTGGRGEQGMNIQTVTETTDTIAEDVIPLQSRHLKKRKTLVADAGGPSHPPKKLRNDHGTLSETFVGGNSMSVVQRLFAGAVQHAEVRGEPIPTMPFVTSSVSATLEREGEDYSHHSGATIVEAEVDSFARPSALVITAATAITLTADPAVVVKEKIVEPFLFAAESTFADGTDPVMAGLTDLISSDFLGNVTNGSRLDDGGVCREMVDEFAPPKFFASVRGMEHDQLFTKFNVVAAHQMSLSAEVRMRAEYNIRENRRLKSVVEEKNQLLKARDEEIKNFKAQLLLKEAEAIRLRTEASKLKMLEKSFRDEVNALNERNIILEKERNALDVKSQNDNLVDQVHELQVSSSELKEKLSNYENLTERLEEFQDAQLKVVNDKLTSYVDGLPLGQSLARLSRKAIEKGMHDGLAAEITHGRKGHALTDVAAHNPSAESDYVSAIQQLQSVNFPLLVELKTNKDASIEAVMNIMRLEEHLAERLGLTESQPHADQLMVPIHHSPDKTVVGASALSLALDVSDARVRRIRENIMTNRYLFQDAFIPLAEPLSPAALTGMKGTSNAVPATADITTALSVTLASTGTVTPLFVDDYGVIGTYDQSAVDEDANPFSSVDDAELNIPQ
nr:transposase (putative), gypsy type [Tanacetum cinerariifolium]